MKINVLLLAFILITFSVFKAAIIPNTAIQSIEQNILVPTLSIGSLTTAFSAVGSCSGLTGCTEAVVNALLALFYFIGQLFIAIFFIIVDIFLLIALFLAIGFSPIPTAPVIVNVIIVGTFSIMLLVAIVSFWPGED